jgi:hypothetical protein
MNEFVAIVTAFICAVGILLLGYSLAATDFEKQAIEIGCAQYNPQTAEFEWLNKNVSEKPKQ